MLELPSMAMPMPSDAHDPDLHTSAPPTPPRSAGTRPSEQPPSGPRVRGPAPKPLTPDEEATLLMLKLVDRIEVARSFARIAARLLTLTAARTSGQLLAVADAKMGDTLRIARAAKQAAFHVATHRPAPGERDERDERDETDGPTTQQAPAAQDAAE